MLDRPKPKPKAERQAELRRARDARHRRRLREGKRVARFEYDGEDINWLIKIRAVDPRDVDGQDPKHVDGAVGRGIEALLKVSSRS
jgi:hypothetical protein